MKKTLAVLFLYMRVKAKGKYEYRAAFWLDALSFLFGYGAQTLLMVLLTQKFDTINGWTPFEVMLLYAYTLASYTLANALLSDVMWSLSRRIRTGDFDQTLTKPMKPLTYEIVTGFSPYYFLHFFLALGMVAIGVTQLHVPVTPLTILQIACGILGGACVQGGVLLLFASASFFLINNPLTGNFYTNIRPLVEYPISIYPKFLQFLLTTLIPLAFVSFYPVQQISGRQDFGLFPPVVRHLSLPVGIAFLLIAYAVFAAASKHYKSTGS